MICNAAIFWTMNLNNNREKKVTNTRAETINSRFMFVSSASWFWENARDRALICAQLTHSHERWKTKSQFAQWNGKEEDDEKAIRIGEEKIKKNLSLE